METRHTPDNPLKLIWNGVEYKVNKPNQETQELVSKEVADELLEALNMIKQSDMAHPSIVAIADHYIKKATL